MVDSEGKTGSFRGARTLEEKESDEESTCSSFRTSTKSTSESVRRSETPVPFKPVNFPLSESFSQKPRFIADTLPGVVPVRATPFDVPEEQERCDYIDESLEDPDDGVTLCHCLFAGCVLILAMLVAMIVLRKTDSNYVSNLFMYDFDIGPQVNEKVVGQGQAVDAILQALKNMTHQNENSAFCKILILTGGPGVGKDYTAHIIKDHFFSVGGDECKKYSHHDLRPNTLSESHYCWRRDFNLFTFDTIYSMDDAILQKSIDTLRFIRKLCFDYDRKLTLLVPVLPIKAHSIQSVGLKGVDTFSSRTEYLNFVKKEALRVQKTFENAGIAAESIVFQPLSWGHAKTCIARSVQEQGRATLSHEAIDEISNLLKPFDHETDFVPVGCKDVDAMVALLPPKAESAVRI